MEVSNYLSSIDLKKIYVINNKLADEIEKLLLGISRF